MTAHIHFDNVSVRYGTHHAVQGVTASIDEGSFVALVGPNGSGKSTLLSLLTGHHPPYSGRVYLGSDDVARLRGPNRAFQIGVMRQNSGPLPDVSVGELVALGPRSLSRTETRAALRQVGLIEAENKPVPTLSGGELQRALLARAIRWHPRLLVLDEPTNHLDVHQQLAILEMVKTMEITVVTALHDLDLAYQFADYAFVLSEGRLVAQGTPDEAFSHRTLDEVFHVAGEILTTSYGDRLVIAPSSHSRERPRDELAPESPTS